MKYIVPLLAVTALCSGVSVQSAQLAEKKPIRVVKDFSPLTPVTVELKQDNNPLKNDTTFYRNTDRVKKQLSYNPSGGQITIILTINKKEYDFDKINPAEFAGKEIHITKDKEDATSYNLEYKPIQSSAPKKRPIRAFKSDEKDQGEEWEIRITDKDSNVISTSKFKKNTDYKVKKLSVQLNDESVLNDIEHPNEKYNVNYINKVDGKTAKEVGPIFAGQFKPGNELEFKNGRVFLIRKGSDRIDLTAQSEFEIKIN